MAGFDGSGNFTRLYSWVADAAAGTKIRADRHDDEDNGFANGLSQTILKTGVSVIANDIPWNSKKIINLGNPTNPADAVNKQYVDGVRTFSSAISITGSTPESRLKFTGTTGPWGDSFVTPDLSFGVNGTPAWVWNDKADFSGTNIMVLTSVATSTNLILMNTDAGAGSGPNLTLDRNSASPAVGDTLALINFQGRSSTGVTRAYAYINAAITDPTNASEDAYLRFVTMSNGAQIANLTLSNTTGHNFDSQPVGFSAAPPANMAGSIYALSRITLKEDLNYNVYFDGTNWRTAAAGWACNVNFVTANGTFQIVRSSATVAAGGIPTYQTVFSISAAGDVAMPQGNLTVTGTVYAVQNYISTTAAALLGTTGSGTIYIRPSGSGSVVGGVTHTATIWQLDANASVQAGKGIGSRSGANGVYGGNLYNFAWTGSATQLWVDASNTGNITVACDYRIKKDVVDLPSTWDRVKALRPIAYTQAEFTPPAQKEADAERMASGETEEMPSPMYPADDIERWGFIAHELQETLLPVAASGVKDAPDEVQSLNLGVILAAVTRALQEAMARIEKLEGTPA